MGFVHQFPFPKMVSSPLENFSPHLLGSPRSACHSTLPRKRRNFHETSQAVQWGLQSPHSSHSTLARHLTPPGAGLSGDSPVPPYDPFSAALPVCKFQEPQLGLMTICLIFSPLVIGASIVEGLLCARRYSRQLTYSVSFNARATTEIFLFILRSGMRNSEGWNSFHVFMSFLSALVTFHCDQMPDQKKANRGEVFLWFMVWGATVMQNPRESV